MEEQQFEKNTKTEYFMSEDEQQEEEYLKSNIHKSLFTGMGMAIFHFKYQYNQGQIPTVKAERVGLEFL